MKNKENRLKRLEDKVPSEPVFIEWQGGRHWTEEEKAEAIRLHPNAKCYWMSLRDAFGFGKGIQEYTGARSPNPE